MFESFGRQEEYRQKTAEYAVMARRLGVMPENGIFDCHEWVSAVSEKVGPNVRIFLFDESKDAEYQRASAELDSEFEHAFEHIEGAWPYFDYVLGHSFILDGDTYVDLTLDSEVTPFSIAEGADIAIFVNP